MDFAGLKVTLPDTFHAGEALLPFRAPAPAAGDPRVLHKQRPVRASFLVHRRHVGAAATLELLAGEVCAELMCSVNGLTGLATEPITYADGAAGVVVGFDFPAPGVATARQYHALRLDAGLLTTQTLTVDALTLNDAEKQRTLAQLASITLAGSGALS